MRNQLPDRLTFFFNERAIVGVIFKKKDSWRKISCTFFSRQKRREWVTCSFLSSFRLGVFELRYTLSESPFLQFRVFLTVLFFGDGTDGMNYSFSRFLIACYATLHPALLVRPSHLTFFGFLRFLASLPLPK